MNRFDGFETVFYSDGSARIGVGRKQYLCLDWSEIRTLFQKANDLSGTGRSTTVQQALNGRKTSPNQVRKALL